MRTTILVLFVVLVFGPTSRAFAQFNPNDPLLRLADDFLKSSVTLGAEGAKKHVLLGDKPEDVARLAAIYQFADSCKESAVQQRQRPQTLNVFTVFLARRPTDKDGKPLDEVLLRIDVPPLLGLLTKDGKVATLIIWTLKFKKESDTYLLESISREYTNDSGQSAGV